MQGAYQGDSTETLRFLNTFGGGWADAVVTDPAYGLSAHSQEEAIARLSAWIAGEPYLSSKRDFMGKTGDSWVPGPEVWREVYRALKPGGHALVFAGARSIDLMSMAPRLAGYALRGLTVSLKAT